jgi:hypothetical protein
MFSIGNNELKNRPRVKSGDIIIHKNKEYLLHGGKRKNPDTDEWEDSDIMLCYTKKNGKSYLAAINGKLLPNVTLK